MPDAFSTFEKRCDIYFARLESRPPKRPEYTIIDMTHRCNLNCLMCDIVKDGFKKENELTTAEIISIIDQLADWGVKEVVFSGGEPLVREDIFKLIRYATRKINVGLLSNGTTLNEKTIKKLTPYLSSGCLSLTISLDGIRKETHDLIRGMPGSFEKTTKALKILSKLKKSNPKINFSIISIIMNQNLEESRRIAEFAKSLGASSIQFQPLLPNNLRLEKRYKTPLWVPENRYSILDHTIDELLEMKRQFPDFIYNTARDLELMKKYFRGKLTSEDVKCYAIFKTMLISMDGKVTACGTCYGDIRKQGLEQCWNSDEAKKSRQIIMQCKNPCLLPCFTGSELFSLRAIAKQFLLDISKLDRKTQRALIEKAVSALDNYEKSLMGGQQIESERI